MKLGPIGFLQKATKEYRKWHAEQIKSDPGEVGEGPDDGNGNQIQKATLDELEEQAINGLQKFINDKNAI